MLDSGVKTAAAPVHSKLATGQSAIYIDEIKGVGAVTEVLVYGDGELKNPLLETEDAFENIRTVRAASIRCTDVDSDGIIEIPVATKLPNAAESDELLYYTNWCDFDGENLVTRKITVFNTIDGYYVEVPKELEGHLAVLKDTENHRRVFYYFDPETGVAGDMLASVEVIGAKKWEEKKNGKTNSFELARDGNNVFVGTVNVNDTVSVSEKELKKLFNLAKQEAYK